MEIMEGIFSRMVQTERLNTHVLTAGTAGGIAVVFLHGNFSAATFWEEAMLNLPAGYFAIAPDLRGYGWSEDRVVDAAVGMGDWSEDLNALLEALQIERAHLVGWSLGGGVLYRFLADHGEKVLSATLVSPVSPYGFGGTKGVDGTPCYDDFAGSGGGTVNAEFIKRIKFQDRSGEDPHSPRNIINTFYYTPPFQAKREEEFLTAALMEKTGDERYPGDFVSSPNWPHIAPGKYGPINAGSPKYVLADADRLIAASVQQPLLWIRGSDDQIVSDNSMFDMGTLGKLGYVPGWPGDDIFPPQPMVSQTRRVLKRCAEKGAGFKEHVIPGTAHSPHIEKPDEFNAIFHKFLGENS